MVRFALVKQNAINSAIGLFQGLVAFCEVIIFFTCCQLTCGAAACTCQTLSVTNFRAAAFDRRLFGARSSGAIWDFVSGAIPHGG